MGLCYSRLARAQSLDRVTLLKVLLPPSLPSSVYSSRAHFYRLLRLLSNDIMQKAKDLIGEEVLEDPENSLSNIKLALRVCAEFRGCYLDYREKSEVIVQKHKEMTSQIKADGTVEEVGVYFKKPGTGVRGGGPGADSEGKGLCAWPPRNSPVFAPLNAIMERCNDLLELVQTLHDFRLELVYITYIAGVDTNC